MNWRYSLELLNTFKTDKPELILKTRNIVHLKLENWNNEISEAVCNVISDQCFQNNYLRYRQISIE